MEIEAECLRTLGALLKTPRSPPAMPSKKPSTESTVAVSAKSVRTAVRKGTLTAEEERVLRARHGVGVAKDELLGRVGQNHPDARARISELELEAFRAMGHIYGLGKTQAQPSKAKDKIVRALRRKVDPR